MTLDSILAGVDAAARWDGWRAIAAVGTMSAVWVALRRDGASERKEAILKAHVVGAMIAQSEALLQIINHYEGSRSDRDKLRKLIARMDNMGDVPGAMSTFFSGLKVSDCPTVEVITTVSVLQVSSSRVVDILNNARNIIEADEQAFVAPTSMILEKKAVSVSIDDLKKEQEWVAGRHIKIGTQDGHRRAIAKKFSSPRSQYLKELPSVLWAIILNKPRAGKDGEIVS